MDIFKTKHGSALGFRASDDVVAVLGIPYAAPPFGANRFREPLPAPAWTGVRDCTDFGPVAPQSAQLPGAPVWSPDGEDILTVNIWTPAPEGGCLPVLVWIHGGAYTFGSSAQPDFDGTTLARAGLVVVTVNYRLGFEGFGHIPAGEGAVYPDNRGLLDQVAALHWVRENIAAFGGDPGNVTVAGQSSGAASVACLMVMDRARDLFHRAIAHSAASPCYTLEIAAATTREVAAAARCPATPAGLTSATPQALVIASDQVVEAYRRDPASGSRHYDPSLYAPVLDGNVLLTDPLTGMAAGVTRGVDLLVCHTTEEYWLLDAVGSSAKITTDEQLALFAEDFSLPDGLVAGYRAVMPHAPVLDVYLAVFGDLLFGEYSNRLAELHTQAGGRAYLSRFDRRRTGPHGVVRAWHCADIPFAFGNLDSDCLAFLIGGAPTSADHQLSRSMVRAWADFAATGDPGWLSVNSTTDAKIWNTDDDPVDNEPAAIRALWAKAEFPVLRP
ncbi:carboxylesterase family protein [Streptomyces sp. NBC_00873]|uniref:carboxylesterase/lipase family protein n=1 Tax=unclassified Streptomyces TaxID=2593676 RepID=UPI00386D7198|nr:carboxylesterase family protein [Streptomyces sp. NBC_00873]WSY96797.1 carboxylesterase family protein [Streptomyces sp. NBC_00873]WTA41430.1 carboxylesterase family protein [Streptomyces sp. NBC_00842]WTA48467.1 carboxylesterase family protein [Streptomyces sp. NBC_00842]